LLPIHSALPDRNVSRRFEGTRRFGSLEETFDAERATRRVSISRRESTGHLGRAARKLGLAITGKKVHLEHLGNETYRAIRSAPRLSGGL
jgi:hypothetical protein